MSTTLTVLELRSTLWVRWGYGERGHNYGVVHTAPACVYIDMGLSEPMDFPFELPKPSSNLVPVEYERTEGVGWRLCREDGIPCTDWSYSKTEEEALAAVQKWQEAHRLQVPEYKIKRTGANL